MGPTASSRHQVLAPVQVQAGIRRTPGVDGGKPKGQQPLDVPGDPLKQEALMEAISSSMGPGHALMRFVSGLVACTDVPGEATATRISDPIVRSPQYERHDEQVGYARALILESCEYAKDLEPSLPGSNIVFESDEFPNIKMTITRGNLASCDKLEPPLLVSADVTDPEADVTDPENVRYFLGLDFKGNVHSISSWKRIVNEKGEEVNEKGEEVWEQHILPSKQGSSYFDAGGRTYDDLSPAEKAERERVISLFRAFAKAVYEEQPFPVPQGPVSSEENDQGWVGQPVGDAGVSYDE